MVEEGNQSSISDRRSFGRLSPHVYKDLEELGNSIDIPKDPEPVNQTQQDQDHGDSEDDIVGLTQA